VTLINTDKVCGKFSKERITLLLCASSTGEKYQPLLIGKKNPRAFKNIDFTKLKLTYRNNKKAWMNYQLFNEWLDTFNKRMIFEKRSILLILDNAPVHCHDTSLSNIELLFLPPNTTSKIQPLDQGVFILLNNNIRSY